MKTKLLFCFLAVLSFVSLSAQNLTVSGTVTEKDSGQPVIGASVIVKGSTIGTTTNSDGTFTLSRVPNGSTLEFSSIGYKTVEVAVEGRSVINVTLDVDTQLLDEIVVIGYGTAKSKDLTGAIATVKSDALVSTPVSSPMGALQGKVPGVQVVNTGEPGASPTVRVRGLGSFDSSYQGPLYVVDGMFFDNIDFLDNNNIESLTVLKDASAAAIYGVRAANGVILVTTKNGIKGETHITYDGYTGFQRANHLLKMANSAEYSELMKEYGDLTNVNASIAKWGGSNGVPSTDTDWYSELLGTGFTTSHSVNVTGSGDKTSYLLGVSYYDQNGIMKTPSSFKRFNILSKGDYTPFDWLKLGANITVSNGHQVVGNNTAFRDAFIMPSIVPVYDKNNADATPTKFASPGDAGFANGYFGNPVARATYFDSKNNSLRVLPSLYADLSFIPNKLKYHFGLSQEYELMNSTVYNPMFVVYTMQSNKQNSLTKTSNYYYNTIIDNTLTYTDSFGKNNITAMIGQSSRMENYRMMQGTAQNIIGSGESQYMYVSLGDADTRLASDNGYSYRGLSFFGRVSYDYDGKYLVSATFRRDGTSKYQEHWGNFPSIGLGWVISKEDFMQNQKVFDFLKLRASWGLLGNDKEPASDGFAGTDANWYTAMNNTLYPGFTIKNTFSWLKWEKVNEYNFGISFSSLQGRLTGDIDYYNRLTTNAVVTNTIPITMETVLANSGSIRNQGFEFQLNWTDKVGELGYSIGLTATTLKNNVVSIQQDVNYILTGTAENRTIMAVGQPMNSFYGYKVAGVYASQAEVDADPIAVANGYKPGYLKYVDMDGDKALTDKDRTYLGSPYPKLTYGGNIALTWRKFDFGMNFYGVSGVSVANSKNGFRNYASVMNFTKNFYSNHWTTSNTTSTNPSVEGLMKASNGQINGYFVQDASYFQLQNIQFGYTFDKLFGVLKTRIYLSAAQPLSIFKYEGFNPEIPSGLDTETYPMAATYSIGANITF
jgi:TonB-linked SusC/RagA family outer membrane protein